MRRRKLEEPSVLVNSEHGLTVLVFIVLLSTFALLQSGKLCFLLCAFLCLKNNKANGRNSLS